MQSKIPFSFFVRTFTLNKKRNNQLIFLGLDLYPSGLTGLEPAASALTGRCSDQLNYNPREIRDLAENLILFYLRIGYF